MLEGAVIPRPRAVCWLRSRTGRCDRDSRCPARGQKNGKRPYLAPRGDSSPAPTSGRTVDSCRAVLRSGRSAYRLARLTPATRALRSDLRPSAHGLGIQQRGGHRRGGASELASGQRLHEVAPQRGRVGVDFRQARVDLAFGVVAVLGEAPLEQPAEHDLALLLLGRDRCQATIDDERPQHLGIEGRQRGAVGPRRAGRHLGGSLELVEHPADRLEPLEAQRVQHVRVARPRIHETRLAQSLEVVDDGARREPQGCREFLDRTWSGRQQADDPQPRRVGERFQGQQEIRVHGPGRVGYEFDTCQIRRRPVGCA
jgi:hypothetical protein